MAAANSTWKQLAVAALLGAAAGALGSWSVVNELHNDFAEHRGLDGHSYVLRLLPRLEAMQRDHERRLDEIAKRLTRIEGNRYTYLDSEKDRRITEVRINSVVERINRLEDLWSELHNEGPP